jgi:hypothetical protein
VGIVRGEAPLDEDHVRAKITWSEQDERLAPRVGVPEERLKKAISDIKGRIAEIGETVEEASSPDFSGKLAREFDTFDDAALRNLFARLVAT